jgi:hypothetical protein
MLKVDMLTCQLNSSVSRKTVFEQAWEEYRTTINSPQTKKVKFIEKRSKFASEWHDPSTAINEAITEVETRSQDYQKQVPEGGSRVSAPIHERSDELHWYRGFNESIFCSS